MNCIAERTSKHKLREVQAPAFCPDRIIAWVFSYVVLFELNLLEIALSLGIRVQLLNWKKDGSTMEFPDDGGSCDLCSGPLFDSIRWRPCLNCGQGYCWDCVKNRLPKKRMYLIFKSVYLGHHRRGPKIVGEGKRTGDSQ